MAARGERSLTEFGRAGSHRRLIALGVVPNEGKGMGDGLELGARDQASLAEALREEAAKSAWDNATFASETPR